MHLVARVLNFLLLTSITVAPGHAVIPAKAGMTVLMLLVLCPNLSNRTPTDENIRQPH
jgi:hypothetical protein